LLKGDWQEKRLPDELLQVQVRLGKSGLKASSCDDASFVFMVKYFKVICPTS